ncbi:MAG: hypothetical protein HY692_06520 [Cyanobacteria bacterium NC_groundwater_1444_Ag_S-0.65um_54_12]|nr:hypothetical protein [Cyanobacteria bacterium NC_groundwater_1444_Ag_S-0.65um_54_12]
MKLLRITVGAVAVAGLLAVVGCPIAGLPPGLGGPTPVPTAFPGFPNTAKLTGRFTFEGKAPPQEAGKALPAAQYKPAGVANIRGTEKATVDQGGHFYFTSGDIKSGSEYQIIWDDGGQTVVDQVNTIGLYVSDSVTSPPTGFSTPQVTLDLKWEPDPKPVPNGTFAGSFTFAIIPQLSADYQISVFKEVSGSKKAVWSSTPGQATTVTWDKSSQGDFAGQTMSPGDYFFQIKFTSKGTTFGSKFFFGSTKYIPFKI